MWYASSIPRKLLTMPEKDYMTCLGPRQAIIYHTGYNVGSFSSSAAEVKQAHASFRNSTLKQTDHLEPNIWLYDYTFLIQFYNDLFHLSFISTDWTDSVTSRRPL